MSAELTDRRPRCILWLSLALALAGLLLAAIVLPWLQWNREYDDRIELRAKQLERYQAQLKTIPVLQERLERLKSEGAQDAFYLGVANESLGGVALQRRLEEMVSSVGGGLTSIQILPAEHDQALTRLSVRARLQLELPELREVLYRIESSEPLMFVEQMTVRAMRPRRRNVRQVTDQSMQLTVNMVVQAYIRKDIG